MMFDCLNCKISRKYGCDKAEYGCAVHLIYSSCKANGEPFDMKKYFIMPGTKNYRCEEED